MSVTLHIQKWFILKKMVSKNGKPSSEASSVSSQATKSVPFVSFVFLGGGWLSGEGFIYSSCSIGDGCKHFCVDVKPFLGRCWYFRLIFLQPFWKNHGIGNIRWSLSKNSTNNFSIIWMSEVQRTANLKWKRQIVGEVCSNKATMRFFVKKYPKPLGKLLHPEWCFEPPFLRGWLC